LSRVGREAGRKIKLQFGRLSLFCQAGLDLFNLDGILRMRENGVELWNVPKRDLIAGVQLALEKGDLRIARQMKEVGALVRELIDVRVTAGLGTGKVRIGADGSGQHDDLVIALALACWRAGWRENGYGPGRLPGV
jgi:hypothetical protein